MKQRGVGYAKQPGPPALEMRRYQTVASIVTFGKTAITRQVLVGTTPTLLITTSRPMAYILTNPASTITSTVITTTATVEQIILGLAARMGINQVTPFIDTTNYTDIHLYLTIQSITGNSKLTVEFLEQDTLGNPYISTVEWKNLNTLGNRYTVLQTFGVGRRFAVRWSVSGTGSITFAINAVLKKPLIINSVTSGGAAGLILIGNAGVTTSSGFALVPGERFLTTMPENTKMFGIAESPLPIHILEMGV